MKNKNRPWRAILFVSFILICRMASGQLPDRVTPTQSFIDTIKLHYAEENSFSLDPYLLNPVVNVPVRVNIILNIKGSAGVTVQDIRYSLDVANNFFKNAGIKFFIDTLQYIKD